MRVRAIGLERFGLDRLRVGAPLSDLEAKLLHLICTTDINSRRP